eukprot:PITA_20273
MVGVRACRLRMVICVVAVMVAATTGVSKAEGLQSYFAQECINPMAQLSPCLDFTSGKEPIEDCCPLLANVLSREPACLCPLFGDDDSIDFPINGTLSQLPPSSCYITISQNLCKDTQYIPLVRVPAKSPAQTPDADNKASNGSGIVLANSMMLQLWAFFFIGMVQSIVIFPFLI